MTKLESRISFCISQGIDCGIKTYNKDSICRHCKARMLQLLKDLKIINEVGMVLEE